MADLSDVENALVALVTAAVYPGGPNFPSAIGASCRIMRGWPNGKTLDADLRAGVSNISVWSDPGMTRNTTRWLLQDRQASQMVSTITTAVSGPVVTFGGIVTAGNVVGIQCGGLLGGSYAYIVQATDTLQTIAAALAAKMIGSTANGATITLPSDESAAAGAMASTPSFTTLRQQEQGFRLIFWCPSFNSRDTAAGLVDSAIAGMQDRFGNLTEFFALADGSAARIRYLRTYVNDVPTKELLWRRDLLYTVEYQTTLVQQRPTVLFGGGTISVPQPGQADGANPLIIAEMSQFGSTEPPSQIATDANGNIMFDAAGNPLGVAPTT